MNDCCNIQQSPQGTVDEKGARSQCSECGAEGRPVERQTILHHVKEGHLDRVGVEAYRFCSSQECNVVYYGNGGTRFTIDDLRELVTAKTGGDIRPICYCFGFTEGDARRQIEVTGSSSIPITISRLIKEGMCACEVRNPAGVCCLGEVNQIVKRISDDCEASKQSTAAPGHDCCAR